MNKIQEVFLSNNLASLSSGEATAFMGKFNCLICNVSLDDLLKKFNKEISDLICTCMIKHDSIEKWISKFKSGNAHISRDGYKIDLAAFVVPNIKCHENCK
jgi:hypothetical protein